MNCTEVFTNTSTNDKWYQTEPFLLCFKPFEVILLNTMSLSAHKGPELD